MADILELIRSVLPGGRNTPQAPQARLHARSIQRQSNKLPRGRSIPTTSSSKKSSNFFSDAIRGITSGVKSGLSGALAGPLAADPFADLMSGGAGEDELRRRAAEIVGLQYDSAENQLNRALQALAGNLDRDVRTQQQYGQIGDVKLQEIYNALGGSMNELRDRTGQLYQNAGNQTNAIYDQAAQAQQQALQGAQGAVTENAKMLGLEEALPEPVAQLQSFVGQGLADNAAAKAAAMQAVNQLGAGMTGVAEQGIADAAKQGAGARTNLVNEVQATIGRLQQEAGNTRTDFLGRLSDLGAERGKALNVTYQDLLDKQGSPIDALMEQLGLEKLGLEVESARQKALGGGEGNRFKGQQGLEQWLGSPQQGFWNQSAGPRFRDTIFDLLDASQSEGAKSGVDPYTVAMQILSGESDLPAPPGYLNKNALRTALNIFFNKYASNA